MSFALFTFYILCSYLRPTELFAPELGAYRPMLWLWVIAFVPALARAISRGEFSARGTHVGLLAAFVAVIAASQFANQWAGGALPSVLDFSTSAMLMVLCFLNLTTTRRVQLTCAAIAASVVVLALISVYSFHTGFMAQELVLRQNTDGDGSGDLGAVADIPAQDTSSKHILRIRSLGFLNDPNDFAQAIVMVLPLLLLGQAGRSVPVKIALVGLPSALLGYAIYLTQSRGALLGIASLALFPLHRWLGTLRTAILLGALALFAVGVSFGGREISSSESSAAQRIDAWSDGLYMLRAKPLFGVGYGNFLDHHDLTAHNSFVLCFSELGLLGYFAWMGLIVLAYKGLNQVIQAAPPERPERALAQALRSSLVGFLACAWFLSRTYQPGLYILLAVCIACWYSDQRTRAAQPFGEASAGLLPPWRKSTALAMLASIATVYAFVLSHNLGR
ncbi:MAG: O-antigen ligase family protein [Burkholderiaceae bacterium]